MSPRLRESCHSLAFSSARSLSTDNISFSSFEVLSPYPAHQHHHHNPNHHHLTKYLFQNLPKVLGGSQEPPDYPLPPQPTPSYQGFLLNFTFCPNIFLGQSLRYMYFWPGGAGGSYPPQYLAFTTASPPYHVRSQHLNHLTQAGHLPSSTKLHNSNKLHSSSQHHLPTSHNHNHNQSHTQPYLASSNQTHLMTPALVNSQHLSYGAHNNVQTGHHGHLYTVGHKKKLHLMQSQTLPRLGGQAFPRKWVFLSIAVSLPCC